MSVSKEQFTVSYKGMWICDTRERDLIPKLLNVVSDWYDAPLLILYVYEPVPPEPAIVKLPFVLSQHVG